MKVIETTLGTERSSEAPSLAFAIIERAVRKLIPLANPDFESSYERVRRWWVEVDERGTPQRELGFDRDGTVALAGPLGDNFGSWTDSTMTFNPAEHNVVPEEVFESARSQFAGKWEASSGGQDGTSSR